MILDNENENLKVHEWISKYTKEGKMSVVTGYFTVGGLAFFSQKTKELIEEYKFVLGAYRKKNRRRNGERNDGFQCAGFDQ